MNTETERMLKKRLVRLHLQIAGAIADKVTLAIHEMTEKEMRIEIVKLEEMLKLLG